MLICLARSLPVATGLACMWLRPRGPDSGSSARAAERLVVYSLVWLPPPPPFSRFTTSFPAVTLRDQTWDHNCNSLLLALLHLHPQETFHSSRRGNSFDFNTGRGGKRWDEMTTTATETTATTFFHPWLGPALQWDRSLGIDVGIHFLIYEPSERRRWEQRVICNCQTQLQIQYCARVTKAQLKSHNIFHVCALKASQQDIFMCSR